MAAYKWMVLSNTTIGSLMAAIDSSIVLISLPTILQQLPGTGVGEGIWIIMSYQLVTATLLLNFGRLGDIFGRVKMYNIGFAIFTVGSLLCSISETGIELVIFRLVQALGSALLWANAAAIITDAFPVNERGRALGINQIAIVAGSVVGLVLGGILTVTLGWRSIFWVNVPIGIFGTIWAHKKLKELANIKRGQKLDIPGNITFVLGLTLILIGVTFGSLSGWSNLILALLGLGGVLLVGFLYIETKVPEPMFHLVLFKNRVFAAGNVSAFLIALARGAFTFMMVFYLQGVLGYDALTAGILLIPMSVAVSFFGPVSGWLSDKFGARLFATAGLFVNGFAFLFMAQLPAGISYYILVIPLILFGTGIGLFSSPNRSETLSSVPASRRGVASGTNSTLINVGMLLSLGLSILIIAESVPHSVIVSVFGGVPPPANSAGAIDIASFMLGLHTVYYLSALFCFAGMFPTLYGYRKAKEHRYGLTPTTVDEGSEEELTNI
ncbi:MAG TPA: MFS transporter [Nitrososphaerales archaeon]|nr:MFS transporter [Nitrososphaerales archaeon]